MMAVTPIDPMRLAYRENDGGSVGYIMDVPESDLDLNVWNVHAPDKTHVGVITQSRNDTCSGAFMGWKNGEKICEEASLEKALAAFAKDSAR